MRAKRLPSPDLKVLKHHIYEYSKGIRSMMLHTMMATEQQEAEGVLKQKGIAYYIDKVSDRKINIFFGKPECIEVVKSFGKQKLSSFSPEEDFILGVLLGYSPCLQCDRFLKMKKTCNVA